MCRIAGIISNKLTDQERYHKVKLMCDALQHGGPDDEGVTNFDQVNTTLGHRRLSIIDLTINGHQPMADAARRAWINFNGEIYNYLELKTELLAAGAQMITTTDTEVIVQAYLHWGVAAFNRLRGMFAFALYDVERASTYLVRDTAGIKPLYYFAQHGELSFASEVKALKQAGIATQANKTWAIKFLAFGHIPEPETTLAGVYCLPKGCYLHWDHQTGRHTIHSYQTPDTSNIITDIREAKELINSALSAAVQRQLIADAPIGVFLSGGIDSSIVTLLANKYKHQQLKTVSLFFNEKAYDEHLYQELVSSTIQGEKFTHLVKQKDLDSHLPDILNAMDMPTTDGVNSWFISKFARQDGLKAVLSGIGGDEQFGGYPSFQRIKYVKHLRNIPAPVLKFLVNVATDRYKKLEYLSYKHPYGDYLFLRGIFTIPDIAAILDLSKTEVANVLFYTNHIKTPGTYDERHAAWLESNLYMQNQLLHDSDIMSMCHGLEVRVPFLDEDFQAAVNRISPNIKFDKHLPKKLLIDSFADTLPKAVWDRPKMGFSFPLQNWMRENNMIADEAHYKNKTARNVITQFKNGHVHWSKAFALYQISLHG